MRILFGCVLNLDSVRPTCCAEFSPQLLKRARDFRVRVIVRRSLNANPGGAAYIGSFLKRVVVLCPGLSGSYTVANPELADFNLL